MARVFVDVFLCSTASKTGGVLKLLGYFIASPNRETSLSDPLPWGGPTWQDSNPAAGMGTTPQGRTVPYCAVETRSPWKRDGLESRGCVLTQLRTQAANPVLGFLCHWLLGGRSALYATEDHPGQGVFANDGGLQGPVGTWTMLLPHDGPDLLTRQVGGSRGNCSSSWV